MAVLRMMTPSDKQLSDWICRPWSSLLRMTTNNELIKFECKHEQWFFLLYDYDSQSMLRPTVLLYDTTPLMAYPQWWDPLMTHPQCRSASPPFQLVWKLFSEIVSYGSANSDMHCSHKFNTYFAHSIEHLKHSSTNSLGVEAPVSLHPKRDNVLRLFRLIL